MSDEFGKCDRLNNCGYFRAPNAPPRELATPEPVPQIPQQFIHPDLVKGTFMWHDRNPFIVGLKEIFPSEKVDEVVKKLYIGTTKNLETVFWLIHPTRKIWNAKIIKYNGIKRDKEKNAWYFKKKEDGFLQTFFGFHLFDMKKDTKIVESEKTVVFGMLIHPEFNWLGAGSNFGITNEKARQIKELGYVGSLDLLPDCDKAGREGFTKGLDNLDSYSLRAKIQDIGDSRDDGADFADIVLERMGVKK